MLLNWSQSDFSRPTQRSGTGTCFSKVPKLFGRISGDIILFVSSKRRPLEARNFAAILICDLFITYEKTSFNRFGVLRMPFRARKVLGTFETQAPDPGIDLGTSRKADAVLKRLTFMLTLEYHRSRASTVPLTMFWTH